MKSKKKVKTIKVTEKKLAEAWDKFVVPRSKRVVIQSKYSASFKQLVKHLKG